MNNKVTASSDGEAVRLSVLVLSRDVRWISIVEAMGAPFQCTAADGADTYLILQWIDETNWDLVILDSSTIENTQDWLVLIRQSRSGIKILVVTAAPDWRTARSLLAQGAADYLYKVDDQAELAREVGRVIQEPLSIKGGCPMCKPKILHYDNRKEEALDRLRHTIELEGLDWNLVSYLVRGPEDIDELRDLLTNEWWHFVICDIHLLKDIDLGDELGLSLAENIDSTIPRLVWTGFNNVERTRRALRTGGVDSLDKSDAGSAFAIIRIIRDKLRHGPYALNLDLEINPGADVSFLQMVEKFNGDYRTAPRQILERQEEIRDLFRKLFRDHTRISLDSTPIEVSDTAFLQVYQSAQPGEQAPVAVQCGPRAMIREAYRRWQEYGVNYLDDQAVQNINFAETLHYGALAYRLTQPFENFRSLLDIFNQSNEDLLAILDQLFEKVFKRWINSKTEPAEQSFQEIYLTTLALKDRRADIARELHRNLQMTRLFYPAIGTRQGFGDRLVWQEREFIPVNCVLPAIFDHASLFGAAQDCRLQLTHGNLTLDAVRVHPRRGDFWVLPSQRMGPGFFLRDLISLEDEVLFRRPVAESPEELLAALRAWLSPNGPDEEIPVPEQLSEDFRKRLAVAQKLRRLAGRLGAQDLRLYYAGLMMHAAARLADNGGGRLQPVLAVALVLLADRLEHWDAWAPRMVTQERVEIDLQKKMAYIPWLHRWVKMEPQPLKLLNLLLSKAGGVCSIEECEKAWAVGAEMSEDMLNRATKQLRKAIEPDPENPVHVIRHRGEGIELRLS